MCNCEFAITSEKANLLADYDRFRKDTGKNIKTFNELITDDDDTEIEDMFTKIQTRTKWYEK